MHCTASTSVTSVLFKDVETALSNQTYPLREYVKSLKQRRASDEDLEREEENLLRNINEVSSLSGLRPRIVSALGSLESQVKNGNRAVTVEASFEARSQNQRVQQLLPPSKKVKLDAANKLFNFDYCLCNEHGGKFISDSSVISCLF
ncbi:uncharacterized protein DFL_002949 [Arthrobotrys flagrans]|uniref:Uncharacterized protein n=1 Tax=Arthrobotrys flagrans TaxID=97331 RepID=A0A437ABY2_ARTFL|nr:hypothetical protein DFL_002949 [Arthrobotrys flagrans]